MRAAKRKSSAFDLNHYLYTIEVRAFNVIVYMRYKKHIHTHAHTRAGIMYSNGYVAYLHVSREKERETLMVL